MPATPDGRAIHDTVARAAGLRHRAARRRRAWRAAPFFAAFFLVIAVAGRLAGWPALLALAGGLALALLLGGYALLPRRAKSVSDAEAASLDDRAALGGELRSAHWFAGETAEGAWVRHHLARAADRIRATAWQDLYAPSRAPRAYAATILLAAAAIAVAVMGPSTRAAMAPGAQRDGTIARIDPTLTAEEIERQLAELLASLEAGESRAGRAASADDIRKLLERVRESQRQGAGRSNVPIDDELRARLDRASQMESLDADMRSALEDLKKALPASPEQNAKTSDAPRETAGQTDAPAGNNAQQQGKGDGKPDPAAQMTSDAQPGGGYGIVAVTNDPSGSGKPGLGLGGGDSGSPNAGVMAQLGAALRQESIETGAGESLGDPATELKHKTDRGTASVAFSRGAAAAAVRGRANAVPIVPEARRPAARAYFQRKK